MKRGYDLYYTLDKVLLKLAGVRMAQSYNFPAAAECGGTLTYRYDQQNGMEGMLFMLSAAASDADILAGIGSCYNAVGMSAEMMIVQEEWLKAAHFLRRGLNTDLLAKGLESIRNIGPGGNFLMDSLTIELLRSNEHFSSDIIDFSGGYGESPSLLERAHEKAEEMAANFTSPIPEKRQNELRRYFRKLYEN
jgi:trimethylamine--corrinoid protein Co-methyltransferase